MITLNEKNALRFYQGDIVHYDAESVDDSRYQTAFYQTRGAYQILNMLLYPGIENERTRICLEKKKIPIQLLGNMKELLEVYKNIFSLMCKCSFQHKNMEHIHVYRKDRIQSMEMIRCHQTVSFLSCSMRDEIDNYFFKNKAGILLLELEISNGIPFVNVNEVLSESVFQEQEEILLPPFVQFNEQEMELTEKECMYRDINQEPPKAKYLLKPVPLQIPETVLTDEFYDENSDMQGILQEDHIINAQAVLTKLTTGEIISEDEEERYCKWKQSVQREVRRLLYNSGRNL
jgi:hypothetical protein